MTRDEGISNVVGTILVAGILVATMVTVRVTYVPVWEKETEAFHMDLVERQLVDVRTEAARLVGNGTGSATTFPISLGSERSFLLPPQPPHQLAFNGSGKSLTVSSTRMTILQQNTTVNTGVTETFRAIGGSTAVSSVSSVLSLRIRLAEVDNDYRTDTVTATITNANAAFAGDLRILVSTASGGYRVDVRVRDAASSTLHDQGRFFPTADSVVNYYVDLLDPEFRFDRVLAAAATPMTVTFSVANQNVGAGNQDLTATYAMAYARSGSIQEGGGATRTPYGQTHSSGTLQYTSTNAQLVNSRWLLEHGAVLVVQPDGTRFALDPLLSASIVGNVSSLSFVVPSLTGTTTAATGDGTGTIDVAATSQSVLVAQAPRVTITVATASPATWNAFFRSEMESVGYVLDTQFTLSTTSTTATLTVYGPNTDPASTYNDVFVSFRQANISVGIKG